MEKDSTKTDAAQEALDASFEEGFEALNLPEDGDEDFSEVPPEAGVSEGVGDIPHQGVDPERDNAHVGGDEYPEGGDPSAYAQALDEIHRAHSAKLGLVPDLKGKSEDWIIRFGSELSTKRREREREFQERLTQQRQANPDAADGSGPSDTDAAGGTEADAAVGTPDLMKEASTGLVEELGEEVARPVVSLIEGMQQEIADLKSSRTPGSEGGQPFGLEAAVEKSRAVLADSRQELQNQETWNAVVAKADALAQEPEVHARLMEVPEADRLDAVLKEAADAVLEAKHETSRRRVAAQPSASSARPKSARAKNWQEHFDREFDERYA